MSRFLKIMIVLLTIAAVAAPVMAEDKLSLSGEMRVRGWYKDYDSADQTDSYMDQRLRIFGNLNVAEGVKIQFRTDVTERNWGAGGSEYGSGRMPQDGQQWDRAYLDLTKGAWSFRAGQMYAGYSLAQTVNSQDAGLKIDYKGPVTFSAFWLLDDARNTAAVAASTTCVDVEGTCTPVATPAVAASNRADSYLYAANVGVKNDAYKANFFAAGQTKALDAHENAYMFGADLVTNLAAVKLQAELNFFTGDASATEDAIGTQFFLDGSMAATETLTVGGQFYYAQAADTDEVQYTVLGNDFNGYDPLFDLGTNLSNEQINLNRPFDFTGDCAGAVGARLYVNSKVSDAVKVGASIAYLEPEDDANTDTDSAMFYAAALTYAVMANTSLQVQLEYVDWSNNNGVEDESATLGGVGLYVNF